MALQGEMCVRSLDSIYVSCALAFDPVTCQALTIVRIMLPGHLEERPWGQIAVWSKKLLQKEEAYWGDFPVFPHGSGDLGLS